MLRGPPTGSSLHLNLIHLPPGNHPLHSSFLTRSRIIDVPEFTIAKSPFSVHPLVATLISTPSVVMRRDLSERFFSCAPATTAHSRHVADIIKLLLRELCFEFVGEGNILASTSILVAPLRYPAWV